MGMAFSKLLFGLLNIIRFTIRDGIMALYPDIFATAFFFTRGQTGDRLYG